MMTVKELFEWWENDQKSIWLGCFDDDSIVYNVSTHK